MHLKKVRHALDFLGDVVQGRVSWLVLTIYWGLLTIWLLADLFSYKACLCNGWIHGMTLLKSMIQIISVYSKKKTSLFSSWWPNYLSGPSWLAKDVVKTLSMSRMTLPLSTTTTKHLCSPCTLLSSVLRHIHISLLFHFSSLSGLEFGQHSGFRPN